jgi:hypothetical protein
MKITRSISEPIRQNLTRNERWDSDDNGLIACWERGREKALEEPGLATSAIVGQLVLLPWKGGVERALKKKEKYGCYNYLAMWQGLRGEDLSIDTSMEVAHLCSVTGMKVIYTSDYDKYKEV